MEVVQALANDPPPQPQSFASRRCSGDPSGLLSKRSPPKLRIQSGYKITIKPGDKGQVPWYADNDKIERAGNATHVEHCLAVPSCVTATPDT